MSQRVPQTRRSMAVMSYGTYFPPLDLGPRPIVSVAIPCKCLPDGLHLDGHAPTALECSAKHLSGRSSSPDRITSLDS